MTLLVIVFILIEWYDTIGDCVYTDIVTCHYGDCVYTDIVIWHYWWLCLYWYSDITLLVIVFILILWYDTMVSVFFLTVLPRLLKSLIAWGAQDKLKTNLGWTDQVVQCANMLTK